MLKRSVVIVLVLVGVAGIGCSPTSSPTACDRDCLVEIAEQYLDALASRDPEQAALSENIRFVENVTPMQPGEGLWASAAGAATGYRILVSDPVAQTIGFMTVIDHESEHGVVAAQLAARLLVRGREIVEAEHILADVSEEADRSRLVTPRPGLRTEVPLSARMSREAMSEIAASYYEALDRSDAALASFAPDCERLENGMITAGPGLQPESFESVDVNGRPPPAVARDCAGQVNSRRFAYIDSIDNRRIFAVDPVSGLAMGFSHFRQSMKHGPHLMIAADGTEHLWDELREPYDLPAAHIFRISDNQIHEVEAIGIFVPYASPTGWE